METSPNSHGKGRATRLGPLLDKILAGYGLGYKLKGWRIVARWPEIVGDKMAAVSKALKFSDDTLLVSVPDAVWRHQLSLEVDAILDKIHSVPGGRSVKRIHFVS